MFKKVGVDSLSDYWLLTLKNEIGTERNWHWKSLSHYDECFGLTRLDKPSSHPDCPNPSGLLHVLLATIPFESDLCSRVV
jgi:hypothetical protein